MCCGVAWSLSLSREQKIDEAFKVFHYFRSSQLRSSKDSIHKSDWYLQMKTSTRWESWVWRKFSFYKRNKKVMKRETSSIWYPFLVARTIISIWKTYPLLTQELITSSSTDFLYSLSNKELWMSVMKLSNDSANKKSAEFLPEWSG